MDTKQGLKRVPVMFNEDHKQVFDDLNLSIDFPTFVKSAFFEKVDRIKKEVSN